MRFKDDFDTVICEDCGREINHLDNKGWIEIDLCSGCSARRSQEYDKQKCHICKKVMKDENHPYYNIDDGESLIHEKCFEKLSEEKQEEWSDDYY